MSNCDSLIKNVIVHQILSIILINIQIMYPNNVFNISIIGNSPNHVSHIACCVFQCPLIDISKFWGNNLETNPFSVVPRAQMTNQPPPQKQKKTSSLTSFRQEMMTVIASGQGWGYLTMSLTLLSCVLRSSMRVPIHWLPTARQLVGESACCGWSVE